MSTIVSENNGESFMGTNKKNEEVEQLLSVAALAEQSIANRRAYEWQLNLAVWTGVPVMTGFLAKASMPITMNYILAIFYLVVFYWYWHWTDAIQEGHTIDKKIKHEALARVLDIRNMSKPERLVPRDVWLKLFVWTTGILLLMSSVVLFSVTDDMRTDGYIHAMGGKSAAHKAINRSSGCEP